MNAPRSCFLALGQEFRRVYNTRNTTSHLKIHFTSRSTGTAEQNMIGSNAYTIVCSTFFACISGLLLLSPEFVVHDTFPLIASDLDSPRRASLLEGVQTLGSASLLLLVLLLSARIFPRRISASFATTVLAFNILEVCNL